jgi:aminopeptidase
VTYSAPVRPGKTAIITGGVAAEPLMRAVYREIIAAGGHPVVVPTFSGLAAELLRNGSDEQIGWISPVETFLRCEADIVFSIIADTNTKALAGVDPARQQRFQAARTDLFKTFMERSASGDVEWALTLYPTDAHAQDAELSTADFSDFVFAACKLNTPNPVAAWREQAEWQQRLIAWLDGKSELHLTGPGTDLRMSVAGRTWINADGTNNMPDGEIFTGPVESSTSGTVAFTYPVVTAGREIAGIVLRFEEGRVVEASATKGDDYLQQVLETDEGARYLGEIAFGTNFDIQRFSKNILFDEKIGGTVHMAIGAGYPETGNTNQSAVHWDMICDLREGGQVTVDGELFLKDGTFVV